ncbi:hypothetical protein A2914_02025 [Candidatus Nomurabacteria bacterium RIFCSPLOWO2_01_FULL_41_21]|uniref:RNA polymerase alpha subunit C-terminal domain-containing protein n=2 Tax=Candidatus Nomuraibacteriota TaxID=1752729 RepID=A0A1F6V2N5_9BACT|nr:MAG: hypothetical protein A2733_01410 [Candidatus Nomurabacteria bacterium RIFCSPHIGHO2_01_FULL_40_20]OGI88709.1 MAG: hypothetical protein A2914_02025 [Candidatus Nomurabacteria bacterium RIFCSPLOWO2_01_FULL_41_21]
MESKEISLKQATEVIVANLSSIQQEKDKNHQILIELSELGTIVGEISFRLEQVSNRIKMLLAAASTHTPLAIPLEDLDLSERAYNTLKAAKINTLGEIVKLDRHELLKCRNLGKTTLAEIEEFVQSKGLQLGMKNI